MDSNRYPFFIKNNYYFNKIWLLKKLSLYLQYNKYKNYEKSIFNLWNFFLYFIVFMY